ncbi:uncharacterized protein LOC125497627 [Beta vulgaris subsp. vulgaris]|uniref:uncharacterized protein LOC125497627 n=1 Tax=Beta vulgaris subsp. vulgaris TaxID=3555 RepID=UPI002036F5F7|nr:uncharacterized protein LOC125497627 [Beta vulgaris subsp. vulgaris]
MLTNNMCETMNAVIKEARDKPVLTCLEWIRRYIMKRHADKWEGTESYTGRFMPYVGKVLNWIKEGAKHCMPVHSRLDHWEVDTVDDRFIVSLGDRYCSCNHWMLTGIPCAHAWACIVAKKESPEDYVDECYSREKYIKAYEAHIKPMPGAKHWDPCNYPEPLPPIIRRMPGRPSLKKRKKEADEEEGGRKKQKQRCSNCGISGHNKKKCKNPTVTKPPPKKGGRPQSNDPWVVATRKKREARAHQMNYVAPSVNEAESVSQNHSCPPPLSSQASSSQGTTTKQPSKGPAISLSQSSKAAPRPKLPTKSLKKTA